MAPGSSRSAPAPRRPAGPHPTRPAVRRRRRGGRVLRGLGWVVLAVVIFLAATAAGLLAAPVDFTPPAPPRPALLLDRNGKIIGELASPEQRTEIPADQIPDVMRNAIVAAEDKSFYSNSGVDPLAIVRAALNDVAGDPTQGGSTITQQYVKNVYVGGQRSYLRKLKEAALAIRIGQRLSKQQILTRYLNEVYFGQGAYGIQAAAQYYFGVDAKDLTLSQASLLAGIVPAPSDYNPVANVVLARQRQQYVLNRMVDAHYIDTATASAAYETVPKIAKHLSTASTAASVAPQFVAQVADQVKKMYADQQDVLYRSGLGVRTTLDVSWQQAANTALARVLPKASDPEAAVVIMDSRDGSILALADKVGAKDVQSDPARNALRVSGSSVKPFTLATALESGDYNLDTTVYGPSRKTYPVAECGRGADGKPYSITNDEGGGGTYTLKRALAESVNTVYGPLAVTLGTGKVYATAQAAGLVDPAQTHGMRQTQCSMGLGVNVTPLNEAVAYSTLADSGTHHDSRQLLSVNAGVDASGGGGRAIFTAPVTGARQAIPAGVASQVQDAMRAVVSYGTGTAAQQPDSLDVYGKTGTTDNYTNAWFSGCLPAYHVCMTTWMGYQTPTPMHDVEGVSAVAGGTLPAKIFAQTMDGYRSRAKPAPAPAPTSSSPAPATSSSPAPAPTSSRSVVRQTRRPPATPTAPTTSPRPASTPATRSTSSLPPVSVTSAPPPTPTASGSSP